MREHLDNLDVEKVIKLYFYYKQIGNIKKMAQIL